MSSNSKQVHTFGCGRSSQVVVERCQGKPASLRQLKVCSVIYGQIAVDSERKRCRPRAVVCFCIDSNRKLSKIIQRGIAECRIASAATDSELQHIGDFQSPERRDPCSGILDEVKDLPYCCSRFLGVQPSHGEGTVQDQTHGRPVSRSAFNSSQSNPPLPLARWRIRSNAARAAATSLFPEFGTSRATGRPWRVMTISSPASTRSRREPRVFFAWNAPICNISASIYQLKLAVLED